MNNPMMHKDMEMMMGDVPKKKKVPNRARKTKKEDLINRKRPRKAGQLLSPTGMLGPPQMMHDPIQIEASIEQVSSL